MDKIQLKKNNKEINWDIPQYLISKIKTKLPIIVLTTGNSGDKYFSGLALPCDEYPKGSWGITWLKDEFELFEDEATLRISND